tara:strand:- start:1805 stop:2335 length:531 start_codon:yes stop_codon:yes gene_type:complete
MKLEEIARLADKIEGAFVDFGFGSGEDARLIFKLMLSDKIRTRDSYYVDLFEGGNKGIWPKAQDLCNELKNRLNKKGDFIKHRIGAAPLSIPSDIALAQLDLGSDNYEGIKELLPKMKKGGIIIIKNYDSNIDKYINEVNSDSTVFKLENISYIIKRSFYTKVETKKVTRTKSDMF